MTPKNNQFNATKSKLLREIKEKHDLKNFPNNIKPPVPYVMYTYNI